MPGDISNRAEGGFVFLFRPKSQERNRRAPSGVSLALFQSSRANLGDCSYREGWSVGHRDWREFQVRSEKRASGKIVVCAFPTRHTLDLTLLGNIAR